MVESPVRYHPSMLRPQASIAFLLGGMLLTNCRNSGEDISDYVDHWSVTRTLITHNAARLKLDTAGSTYRIESGPNKVLTIEVERDPVFKEGKQLEDLYSSETLLIEIDANDSIVSNAFPSKSIIRRLTIAFNPMFGIKPLGTNERIELVRLSEDQWSLKSEVANFHMNQVLHFTTSDTITTHSNE